MIMYIGNIIVRYVVHQTLGYWQIVSVRTTAPRGHCFKRFSVVWSDRRGLYGRTNIVGTPKESIQKTTSSSCTKGSGGDEGARTRWKTPKLVDPRGWRISSGIERRPPRGNRACVVARYLVRNNRHEEREVLIPYASVVVFCYARDGGGGVGTDTARSAEPAERPFGQIGFSVCVSLCFTAPRARETLALDCDRAWLGRYVMYCRPHDEYYIRSCRRVSGRRKCNRRVTFSTAKW